MNTISSTDKVKAAVLGTLVADATGMGVHWIYSQGKIAKIIKDNDGAAEYIEPDESNYKGVPAFFAHPLRRAGDGSNYGEYIYVLLKAISNDGFDSGEYIRVFQEYFGVGGEYVGYADGPMRETIFNLANTGKEILSRVMSCDSSLNDERKGAAAHYISRYFFEHDKEELKAAIRTPLKLQEWSREELDEADRLVDSVSSTDRSIGPDDDQMPALSRSAVLAYFYAGGELDSEVERAVRITNNNDSAVGYSQFMARIMRDIYESTAGTPATYRELLRRSIVSHIGILNDKARGLVEKSLALDTLDYRGVTKQFGAACHVDMAVPVIVHLLLNTGSFAEANDANIRSSGDNCGRAIMLGAIAGAMYGIGGETGIPEQWIERSTMAAKVMKTAGGILLLQ